MLDVFLNYDFVSHSFPFYKYFVLFDNDFQCKNAVLNLRYWTSTSNVLCCPYVNSIYFLFTKYYKTRYPFLSFILNIYNYSQS